MIKKYTYFGFIEISNTTRQDGCSKVIIVDNFSSKKHILEIHEHVYAVDATDDPIIFILLANSIVSAYEMRSEVC
jgi:hypothetical protein